MRNPDRRDARGAAGGSEADDARPSTFASCDRIQCGGEIEGVWRVSDTRCSPARFVTYFRSCGLFDMVHGFRSSGTVELADGVITADLDIHAEVDGIYPRSCLEDNAFTCEDVAAELRAVYTNHNDDVSCTASEHGCRCGFTWTSTDSIVNSYELHGDRLTSEGTEIPYCVNQRGELAIPAVTPFKSGEGIYVLTRD